MASDWTKATVFAGVVLLLGWACAEPANASDIDLQRYDANPAEIAFTVQSIAQFGGVCPNPQIGIETHSLEWWIACPNSFWIIDEAGKVYEFASFDEAYDSREFE